MQDQDAQVSKSLKVVVDKIYGALSAFLMHASKADGNDTASRKSSIRSVQQAHKHLKLFSSKQQRNISTWCDGKVCNSQNSPTMLLIRCSLLISRKPPPYVASISIEQSFIGISQQADVPRIMLLFLCISNVFLAP